MRRLAQIGPIMQLAYVPADPRAALEHWLAQGAGPFFHLPHVALEDVRYQGEPAEIDFSMWLGHWGDLQIEIITQHNDAPSIYKSWRDERGEGLHHVCILADDLSEVRRICAEAGATVSQEGHVPGGGEFLYADTGGGPGTMVEVLRPGEGGPAFFAMLRDAHRDWDGRDPVRSLP